VKKPFIIPQQGESDCGVACLLSLIRYYQGDDTLENLRKISGTNSQGTTLLGLYQAAGQSGFDARGCEADMASLIDHPEPCILHSVTEDDRQHYVVYFGTASRHGSLRFMIGDPATGLQYLDRSELDRIWKSKCCLLLTPNEHFKKEKEGRRDRRKWIWELVKPDFSILVISACIGSAMAILGLSMALFSQRLIDDILPKKDLARLNLGIALVLVLLLTREAMTALRQYCLYRQSKDFNIRIIDFFYNHLLQLPKRFFDSRKIGELTARLNDTSRIQRVVSQLAGNVIIDILVASVSTVFIFNYSWKVGTVCLVGIPVFYLLIYLFRKKIIDGQRMIMSSYAMTESNYISTLQGIEPIKHYNKQAIFSSLNKGIYQNYQDKIFSLGTIQVRLSFLANGFNAIFLIGILLFSSYQVLDGQLKAGQLIAMLGMCGSLFPSVANLALVAIPLNEAKIAFGRMFEFTAMEPEAGGEQNPAPIFQSLSVKHLAYRFAGRRQILKDLSFTIGRGEIIAILGENGSGKSTITQLLQKRIILNGHTSLEDVSLDAWRKIIGVVPQNIHIFNGTVLENIAFDDAGSRAWAVTGFLEEYGLTGFMEGLPQSYMTLVGEEGINLSGGQRQIIALARALYHRPELLILDEATASMDRQTEQFVLQLLSKWKKEMGIIFITHRLHVLRSFCDRIYILENGVVSREGSHHELLATENLYSRYWSDLLG
jgi:ABC-type bacteriocin/lantibiotic exporter with double-glycine peptidase domain